MSMIKRSLFWTVTFSLLLALLPAAPSQAQTIRIVVDGQAVVFDQPPMALGGRVLVPLRGVFEQLGAVVQWEPSTNTVTAERDGTTVQLVIGLREASVDGRPIQLDVPPMVVAGRTLVPLRFVSESLGASVDWDAGTRTVFIVSGRLGRAPAPPVAAPPPPPVSAPPQPALLVGTVVRVDPFTSPPRLLVQREGRVYTFAVGAGVVITEVDVDSGERRAIGLEDIHAGDLARVTVGAGGRAVQIRLDVRVVTGRVETMTARAIILNGGRSFALDDEVRFFIGGRPVGREQLRWGMLVTLRINPQTELVSEVVARPVAEVPPPGRVRIVAVTHDAGAPMRGGETVTVTLRGSPGGAATFDIFETVSAAPMREISPGVYQGTYRVRDGDNVTSAAVFGHLRLGRDEAIARSENGVTLDTREPVVTRRFPPGNAIVNGRRPNILIVFDDRGGSGIDTAVTRLFVDEANVTARADVSETSVAYTPPAPMSGRITVRLIVQDRAGNRTEDRYTFTVAVEEASLIQSVTVQPLTPLRAGEVLSVTMVGAPRGEASFTIEGVARDLRLTESANQPGVYLGSYRVRADDQARDARVLVDLTRGDARSRVEATVRITILAALVPPPRIASPAAGARVGVPLVIRGTAEPGYQVAVRVDYAGRFLLFEMRGTYGQVTTTADEAGRWEVSIQQSSRMPGAQLTITVWTIDPLGRRSQPVTLRAVQI